MYVIAMQPIARPECLTPHHLQQCIGPSMLPTFNLSGDWVLVEHISVKLGRLQQGDVVTCVSPTDPNKLVCKRIIGKVR
jgi:inner membrane protease subunit 1